MTASTGSLDFLSAHVSITYTEPSIERALAECPREVLTVVNKRENQHIASYVLETGDTAFKAVTLRQLDNFKMVTAIRNLCFL